MESTIKRYINTQCKTHEDPQIILSHWMFLKLGGVNNPQFSSHIKTTPLNFAALHHVKTRIHRYLAVKIK